MIRDPTQEDQVMTFIIDLWTDGSGTTVGKPGGWAWVTEDGRGESGFAIDGMTNHRAEMTALLRGLQALQAPAVVVVHSDSAYVLGPRVKDWFPRWRRLGRTSANADLWQALLIAAAPHDLTFDPRVRSHTGVALNEEVDELAGIAREAAIANAEPGAPVTRPQPARPFHVAMAGPDSALCAFLLAAVTFSDASWSARAGGATREPGELRAAFVRRVLGQCCSPSEEDECSPSS